MAKKPDEWLKQADYDMKTAEVMFDNKRYIYTVFMCHLSVEKALKGIYQKELNNAPPKVHNLVFLVEKIGLQLSEDLYDAVFTLNRAGIPTRYPDDLEKMRKEYNKKKTAEIMENSREILKWLKTRR